ncbi:hypothetical protein GSI_02801 [Ganoderma sinense ZZ0214-1]|uniref:Uncharacterized protein n=1 Tax=Ganoderma sinense ZZ0214-1 TaxID=1077348 RepID=A0A2G8SML8_9APHY|nr:hypothetical protein GSI_02801 [Ganoderma sinense ZZ0214-1]
MVPAPQPRCREPPQVLFNCIVKLSRHLAVRDPLSDSPPPPPPRKPGLLRGVDLPDTELPRVYAALAGALHRSGVMTAFEAIESSCKMLHAKACIPWASGSAFSRSVVAYEGQELCAGIRGR